MFVLRVLALMFCCLSYLLLLGRMLVSQNAYFSRHINLQLMKYLWSVILQIIQTGIAQRYEFHLLT